MRYEEDRIEQLTCSDDIKRNIHIWEPEKPVRVFLTVHGVMDHAGNYIFPGRYFRDHGIVTVAHEQRGHDLKRKVHVPRFEVFLDDLNLMVLWVKDAFPGLPVYILAHSMGGLIVTHFGIRRMKADALIKGFIISAPYYVNRVKAPRIVQKMAGLLSAIAPRMTAPIEDILPHVSHDRRVVERHRRDEADGVKPSKVSIRVGHELLKAQAWVPGNITRWKHPLLLIVAGDDKIADMEATREYMGKIDPGLVTELFYPANYHENFNELNREEIFGKIVEWVEQRG